MKTYSKMAFFMCFLTGIVLTTSCTEDNVPAPVAKASIYERLGGTAMVVDPDNPGQMIEKGRLSYRTVVNRTIGLIVADITASNQGNLSAHFAPLLAETAATQQASVAGLSDSLTDFFSFNTGGTNPVNAYNGRSMAVAHNPATYNRMGAKSTNADYNRFVGFVGAAANSSGVATGSELYLDIVAVLESLRSAIVQS